MTYDKYRVIFLGPIGGGKTSAIRTLLKVANSTSANEYQNTSSTSKHQLFKETILGKEIVLVDTPGLSNPSGGNETESELRSAFQDISPGPHIIVIVFSVNTTADVIRKTCLRYQERLGHDVLKHTTIVFTGVDTLEASGTNFQGYIDTLPNHIKQLIGTQLVALNNTSNAPLINVLQVKELMTKFDQILTKNFGQPYNVKRFAGVSSGDIATDVQNVFEKNSQVLENKLTQDQIDDDQQDRPSTGVTVATIEQPPEEHKDTSDETTPSLTHQNGQQTTRPESHHEDVQLRSLQSSNIETVSRVSEDASMITTSSTADKGCQCGCFSSITRRFRSSEDEPGFTQFK